MSQASQAAMIAKYTAKGANIDPEGAFNACSFAGIRSSHSHKYFDSAAITKELGMPEGAGAFWQTVFEDGSSIIHLCGGDIAVLDENGLTR